MTKRHRDNQENSMLIQDKNGRTINDSDLKIIDGNWGTEREDTLKRIEWYIQYVSDKIPNLRKNFGPTPFYPFLVTEKDGIYDDVLIQALPNGLPLFTNVNQLQPYSYMRSIEMYAQLEGRTTEAILSEIRQTQQDAGDRQSHRDSEELRIERANESWEDPNALPLTPLQLKARKAFEEALKQAEAALERTLREEGIQERERQRQIELAQQDQIVQALKRRKEAVFSCAANAVEPTNNDVYHPPSKSQRRGGTILRKTTRKKRNNKSKSKSRRR